MIWPGLIRSDNHPPASRRLTAAYQSRTSESAIVQGCNIAVQRHDRASIGRLQCDRDNQYYEHFPIRSVCCFGLEKLPDTWQIWQLKSVDGLIYCLPHQVRFPAKILLSTLSYMLIAWRTSILPYLGSITNAVPGHIDNITERAWLPTCVVLVINDNLYGLMCVLIYTCRLCP